MLHHEGTKDTKDTKVKKTSALAVSHEIIGAAIEVHRFLGPGLLESVYEGHCARSFPPGISRSNAKPALPVKYKGGLLDCLVKLDLLVESAVIV